MHFFGELNCFNSFTGPSDANRIYTTEPKVNVHVQQKHAQVWY
jgi:hypothetical protein